MARQLPGQVDAIPTRSMFDHWTCALVTPGTFSCENEFAPMTLGKAD